MSALLVDNIGELVTNSTGGEDGPLGIRRNAALLVEDGRVAWIGPARYAPAADRRIDADGAAVLPGFVDSHAHLVFAGDRAAEFAARMAGERYTGGGIRTTVGATRAASDDELRATVRRLRDEAMRQGTTTIEIKSGYGLTVADEARSLRIAAEFSADTTFLGAHVVPAEYADRPDDYVGMVCGPMLALAVREMRMTPAEAVWAATAGGARALRRDDVGRLEPGARADLMILDAPSHLHLAYRPGVPLIRQVLHNGVPQ
ncbi:amidohydrolase family protein [Micromonospora sp. NPDC048830]|uniref:amidohydrolase family protein n=1 Tax=Micromonospora sp. NPDC048830 TaxID=3364257 RepID=UPI00371FFBE7